MKRKTIILFALLSLLMGCSESAPTEVLDFDQMAEILAEMQVVHAGVDLTLEQKDGKLSATQEYNAAILEAQQVEGETFYESYEYYQEHPELMDSVYVRVLKILEAQVDSLLRVEEAGNFPAIEKMKE